MPLRKTEVAYLCLQDLGKQTADGQHQKHEYKNNQSVTNGTGEINAQSAGLGTPAVGTDRSLGGDHALTMRAHLGLGTGEIAQTAAEDNCSPYCGADNHSKVHSSSFLQLEMYCLVY